MTCFDTNTLIFAVEPASGPHVSDHCRRVRHLLERLRDEKTPVMLPVLVLCEFLCKYPPEDHERVRSALADDYLLIDVTPQVASQAAVLHHEGCAKALAAGGVPRQQVKYDQLIAATAVVAGAKEVISEDRDYAQLSGGRLKWTKVSDLPLPPPTLLDGLEPPGG